MNRMMMLGLTGLLLCVSGAAWAQAPKLVLQLGHSEGVADLDVFKKGKRTLALTAGKDKKVKLWDANTGGILKSFDQPIDSIFDHIVVGADGRHAILWPRSGKPHDLDMKTGQWREIKPDRYMSVETVCVSHDRKKVAMTSNSKTVFLATLPNLKVEAEMAIPRGTPVSCAFSRDDKILVVGANTGGVTWLDATNALDPLDQRDQWGRGEVSGLTSFLNGQIWVIQSNWTTAVWDMKARKELGKWNSREANGELLKWMAANKALMRADQRSMNFFVHEEAYWRQDPDRPSKKLYRRTLKGLRGEGPLYGSRGGKDGTAEIWRASENHLAMRLQGTPLTASSITFLADGRHVAMGTRSGEVHIWDLIGGVRTQSGWDGGSSPVTAVAFSADGTWAASGHKSGDVVIRLAKEGREDRRFSANGEVQRLSFYGDNRTLLIQSRNKTVLFRVDSGFEKALPKSLDKADLISTSGDGKRIVFSRNGRLHRLDGDKAVEIGEVKGAVDLVVAGDEVYVVDKKGVVTRRALPSGSVNGTLSTGGGVVRRLTASADGRLVAGAGEDGALRFWRKGQSALALTFFADGAGEWVAWTPKGAFDASARGGRYVAWKVGNEVFPLDRFSERLLVPGLLGFKLGAGGDKVKVEGVGGTWKAPPEVSITSPAPYTSTTTDTVEVEVEAKDAGGGVGVVRLYHQGRLVGEVVGGQSKVTQRFKVQLQAGPNELVASALSKGLIERRSAPVVLIRDKPEGDVRLRVLSIGINDYRDASLKLRNARQDAESFAEALKKGGADLYKGGIDTKVIVDKAATTQGIVGGFQWLIKNTRAEDVAVVFIAGHGESDGDDYFLIPHELKYTGIDSVKKQGISQEILKGLIRQIPARKVIVMLDTCKSGQFSENFGARGFKIKKSLSLLGRTTGTYLMAASTSKQLALEDTKLGHGLFTWVLLQGLSGKADKDKDRAISIHELIAYTETEVARLSMERLGQEQFPVSSGLGQDFPVSRQ